MGKTGGLTAGEPIILADGSRVLASAEQAENPPKDFAYAYALDVTTTQGMSQNGKVIMVVSKETQNNLQGGEILVGATRHKGDFQIRIAADADKDKFFTDSEKQFAAARIRNNQFVPELYAAAKGNQSNIAEKQAEAQIKSQTSRIGLHKHLIEVSAQKKQQDSQIKQEFLQRRQLRI